MALAHHLTEHEYQSILIRLTALEQAAPPSPPPPPVSAFAVTVRGTGLTPSQLAIAQKAADRWAQIITAALSPATYLGVTTTGLLIDFTSSKVDGPGGVLGSSIPTNLRADSQLPYRAAMTFDSDDLAWLEQSGDLFTVILHEMGHCLGLGVLWNAFHFESGFGTNDVHYNGKGAVAQFNKAFTNAALYVPVEGVSAGSGTAYSHWQEATLGNELMTGYLQAGGLNPLSRITVGSLADMGYAVNLAAADPYMANLRGVGPHDGIQMGCGCVLGCDVSKAPKRLKRVKVV